MRFEVEVYKNDLGEWVAEAVEYKVTATEQYGTHSGMLFELLRDAGLEVSLLDDWLNGRPPLTADGFVRSMHVDHEYFFLAHPPSA